MAGSDDRFANLALSMNKKALIDNVLYESPQKRIENGIYQGPLKNKTIKKIENCIYQGPRRIKP